MSPDELLVGAWDVHVHAAPSLFPRWGDGWDLAEACHAARMGGVVLKAHHGSTVEVAATVNRHFEGLTVLGGVVLNQFVGGIHPLIVETTMALGGRIVWMPTIHAAHCHRRRHGTARCLLFSRRAALAHAGDRAVGVRSIRPSIACGAGDPRPAVRHECGARHGAPRAGRDPCL